MAKKKQAPEKVKPKKEEKKDGKIGRVIQVIGPVVDVEFKGKELPEIYSAIRITSEGFDNPTPVDIIVEAEQHLGEDKVRCVAMHPTDGLARGMKAINLDSPIQVPVGEETLGRMMNVIGEPVDHQGPIKAKKRYPIHRQSPSLEEQSTRCLKRASR
jgi:F-type H+-transporting ATPase subunit beta